MPTDSKETAINVTVFKRQCLALIGVGNRDAGGAQLFTIGSLARSVVRPPGGAAGRAVGANAGGVAHGFGIPARRPPRDPADRIIAATAWAHDQAIVTRDAELTLYGQAGHVMTIAC